MRNLIIGVNDDIYNEFVKILININGVEILKEAEEFEIDEEYCIKTLDKIKKGDKSEMKEVTHSKLFEELRI